MIYVNFFKIKMKKIVFLTAAAVIMISAAAQGQNLAAKEQTILNIFGRLNLETDPYDNLYYWTDGEAFYRPFFTDPHNFDAKPLATGNIIYLYGGSLHEGGFGIDVQLASDGKMTIARDDYRFSKGDRVVHRIIGNETHLIFSDARTGAVKDVWKKFDGKLHDLYIANFFKYVLTGKFNREGSSQTITFNAQKSSVTGLFSAGETSFTFFKEYGDTPVPILRFNNGGAYRAARSFEGLILTPMTFPEDDDDEVCMVQDESKPLIFLKRLDESAPGMPPGVYPLASVRLMTDAEIYLYAGDPANANLRIMRNEIFARYGYQFNTEIGSYFADQEWYSPQSSDVTGKLTEIERINIAMILKVEEKVKLASYVEISDPVERQYTNDILAFPEMQFSRAAIMTIGVPSDTEPYYTIKAGSNMEDRFVTNYWFHVYVDPVYAIKVYDVVSDRELSLEEWRKEKEK